MSGRKYCPDCDGFGFIAGGVCASCEGVGTMTAAELRRLIGVPPLDLGDVIAGVFLLAFMAVTPLALLFIWTGRAVA